MYALRMKPNSSASRSDSISSSCHTLHKEKYGSVQWRQHRWRRALGNKIVLFIIYKWGITWMFFFCLRPCANRKEVMGSWHPLWLAIAEMGDRWNEFRWICKATENGNGGSSFAFGCLAAANLLSCDMYELLVCALSSAQWYYSPCYLEYCMARCCVYIWVGICVFIWVHVCVLVFSWMLVACKSSAETLITINHVW